MSSLLKFKIIVILFVSFFTPSLVFANTASDSVEINLRVIGGPLPTPSPSPTRPYPPFVYDTTPPLIYNLSIIKLTFNSATIYWETDENAICQLFWGKTQEYREGSIAENNFLLKHLTQLINLFPETTYHFKIVCRDANRNESETKDQIFTTLSLPDITPPANVINFKAIPGDGQIFLSWENPPDSDFKAVKIMRSEKFYSSNPWEGMIVYNDRGTSFIDTGLKNGVRYYYTAFAYDRAGNYASGAIASAVPGVGIPPFWPPITPIPPEIEKLTLKDFDFIQEGKKLPVIEDKIIKAEPEKLLTVSVDYKKIPEISKTIIITLEKESRFFSFLLVPDKDKNVYQATFFVPKEDGIYQLTITIFDYKNQTLKKITGELHIEKREIPLLPEMPWYKDFRFLYLLLGLLLLIIAYIWKKIKDKLLEKEKQKPPK